MNSYFFQTKLSDHMDDPAVQDAVRALMWNFINELKPTDISLLSPTDACDFIKEAHSNGGAAYVLDVGSKTYDEWMWGAKPKDKTYKIIEVYKPNVRSIVENLLTPLGITIDKVNTVTQMLELLNFKAGKGALQVDNDRYQYRKHFMPYDYFNSMAPEYKASFDICFKRLIGTLKAITKAKDTPLEDTPILKSDSCDAETCAEPSSPKDEDIEVVRRMYGFADISTIAALLSTTEVRVKDIMIRYLKKPPVNKLNEYINQNLSASDISYIAQNYDYNKNNILSICDAINKNPIVVYNHLNSITDLKEPESFYIPKEIMDKHLKLESKAINDLTKTVNFLDHNLASLIRKNVSDSIKFDSVKVDDNANSDEVFILNICDTHFFKYVDLNDVNYMNEYNKDIAITRWKSYIHQIVRKLAVCKPKYVVICLLGDIFNGFIHDSDKKDRNTFADVFPKVRDMFLWGIQEIAKVVKIDTINCCSGNHARFKEKDFTARTFYTNNADYMLAQMLKADLVDYLPYDLTFNICESAWLPDIIEGRGYMFSHGCAIRGGSNMAGMPGPSASKESIKAKNTIENSINHIWSDEQIRHINPKLLGRNLNIEQAIIGHFHNDFSMPGLNLSLRCGLSLMGTDDFAYDKLRVKSPAGQTFYRVSSRGFLGSENILV